jgi:hypothetical protein
MRRVLKDSRGWEIIMSHLNFSPEEHSVYLQDRTGQKTYVDSVENVLYCYSRNEVDAEESES